MFKQLLTGALRRRPGARRPPRAVLAVECLEERAMPSITFTPSTLTNATVGTKYTQALKGHGGTAPYKSFTVSSGTLPAGLKLSATGTISGTATAGGSFSFTVQAGDSATPAATGSQDYTLTVAAPTIVFTPSTLTAATVGASYSKTIKGGGGTAPYKNFTVSSGSLPAGLKLSAAGVLSGKPTAAGSFTFTVTANDSSTGTGPYTGSGDYTLTVNAPAVAVGPSTLAPGVVASAYSHSLSGSGGTAPYKFKVTGGSLPTGVVLNTTTGALTGTPQKAGTFQFTVQATDSSTGTGAPFSASLSYTVTVQAQAPPAAVAFALLLPGVPFIGTLPTFQVEVLDASHKPLNQVTVTLKLVPIATVGPAGFGAGSEVRAVTGANGVATFTYVTIPTRGLYEIEADAGTVKGLSNVFGVGLNGRHSPA
jgi:hypothetical protein